MGRFKRHQRKNKGTETIVADRRIVFPKATDKKFPMGYNSGRMPEISERVKCILNSHEPCKTKSIKDVKISKLISDLLLSVKKRGKYADLLKAFGIDKQVFLDDSILPNRLCNLHNSRYGIRTIIVKNLLYYGRVPTHFESNELYNTLLGRLLLLEEVLLFRTHKGIFTNINKEEILEYYARDEISKMNIKPLPNELVFACLFGTVFSLFGLVVILLSLLSAFGIIVCIIFLFFIGIIASIKIKD